MSKSYVGDTGTVVTVQTDSDISTATALLVNLYPPQGAMKTVTGVLFGTTNIRFITDNSTFDVAGVWRVQADVTTSSGHWLSTTGSLAIYPPGA